MKYKVEVIGFSLEGCEIAQRAGAARIELCDNPGEGGTTPSYGFIKAARKLLEIELYVMIRPRGGDFIYSDQEFIMMKEDIKVCKNLGCDGVVLGLLNPYGDIDRERTSFLTSLAYPMGVTFHRAFDRAKDPMKALNDIIQCGCERILTSGQQPTALEGLSLLKELSVKSGDLIIMPGSGIRANNIGEISAALPLLEFHTSARSTRPSLQPPHPNFKENMDVITTDENEIINILHALKLHASS